MTLQEFSDQFDVLYNNITSNQAPGLNEYEKSVFLTKAQDEIVRKYLDPRSNKVQEGIDDSSTRQIDFSMLMKTISRGASDSPEANDLIYKGSNIYVEFPSDVLIVLNEVLVVHKTNLAVAGDREEPSIPLIVIPINYQDYNRVMSKPYKHPPKYQAWRLMYNVAGSDWNSPDISTSVYAQLIAHPNETFNVYTIRYVRKPLPIIIEPLDGLSLEGYYGTDEEGNPTKDSTARVIKGIECELDSILHQEVLQRAVELAKAAYTGDLQSQVALGQTSQTDIGQVQSR